MTTNTAKPPSTTYQVFYESSATDKQVAVDVLTAVPEADLLYSAVLLSQDQEPVRATLELEAHNQQLRQLISHLALDPLTVDKPNLYKGGVVVALDETQDALFEHFGNTGKLLSPLAAIQLAGAVKMARKQRDERMLFTASSSNIQASPMRQALFMARGRRRQAQRSYGQQPFPWPTGFMTCT